MQNISTFNSGHGRTNQRTAGERHGGRLTLTVLLLLGLVPGRGRAATGIYESYVRVGPDFHVLRAGVNFSAFQGANLGTVGLGQALKFAGSEIKTFKNSGSNVAGADLFYRVYPQGARPLLPIYAQLSLPFATNLDGNGDRNWNTYLNTANLSFGRLPGTYTVAALPTATLANGGSVCSGTSASLTGNLTGTGPWSLTYTSNGANPTTVVVPAGQTSFSITTGTLTATTTFALTALSDADGAAISLPLPTVVAVATRPTATITTGTGNCAGSPATVQFTFTGTGPWNFTYSVGGGAAINVLNFPTVGFNSAGLPGQSQVFTVPAAQATFTSSSVVVLQSLTDIGVSCNALTAVGNDVASQAVPVITRAQWTGNTSTNWFEPTNWNPQCVPSQYIDANISPVSNGRYPTYTSGTAVASVRTLTMGPGARLTYTSGEFNLYGDLSNANSPNPVGVTNFVVFTDFLQFGTSASGGCLLRVRGAVAHTLQLLNAVWDMEVDTNPDNPTLPTTTTLGNTRFDRLRVFNSLKMTSGLLDTQSSRLIALVTPLDVFSPGTARLTETEQSYVLNNVTAIRNLQAGLADDCLGTGLTLTPAAGSPSPGATTITRTTGTAPGGTGLSQGILRYFQLAPAVSTGLNVRMDFGYFNHELNGLAPAELRLLRATAGVSGPWVNQDPIAAAANVVSKTSIGGLAGFWTLGKPAAPLPVSLTAFEATRQGTDALLSWRTASETDNAGFEVQAGIDGTAFRKLGFVAAASASSSTPRSYSFRDTEPGKTGLRYYRLRQVDLDGQATYSPVRSVSFDGSGAPGGSLSAVPNPFGSEGLRLLVQAPVAAMAAPLTLSDALGRVVRRQTLDVPAGASTVALPNLAGLPAGLYLLRLSLGGRTQTLKLVRE